MLSVDADFVAAQNKGSASRTLDASLPLALRNSGDRSVKKLLLFAVAIFLAAPILAQDRREKHPSGWRASIVESLFERYGADYPVGPDTDTDIGISLLERIHKDPNDAYAIRDYATNVSSSVLQSMYVSPDNPAPLLPDHFKKARQKLDDLKMELSSLEVTSPSAKAAHAGAMDRLSHARTRVSLRETPLQETIGEVIKKPNDAEAIGRFGERFAMELDPMAYSNPSFTLEKIGEINRVLDLVEANLEPGDNGNVPASPKWQLDRYRTKVEDILQVVEFQSDRLKAAEQLIGSDAPDIDDISAWINGPLDPDAMEGNVILLDFWITSCIPCIEAFPHLRRWHSAYRNKGLVVLGVTCYQNQRWDSKKNQIEQVRRSVYSVPEPEECSAIGQFVKLHKLEFSIAILDQDKLWELAKFFGSAEIPQLVVIDRQKKIRLIRTGQSDADTKDVDQMLKALLAD